MQNDLRRQGAPARGFSLVEIMMVVTIFGVLASLAVPRYTTFMCRARQTEARTMLRAIGVAQATYSGEFSTYLNLTQLTGFGGLDDQSVRSSVYYGYVVTPAATSFVCIGQDQKVKVNPNGSSDIWSMTDAKSDPANTLNGCM